MAPLLFASGACALVYQVVWLRELRLVFGASTAASAAVLAIFMGGLGAGGLWLGARADRRADPLALYARLELVASGLAALTPFLVTGVRSIYSGLGGTVALGTFGGTVLRLVLAALVLGPPTVFMGGTLPAAARAAETDDDLGRRDLALLYGVNTLGAVVGATLPTLVLFEALGTRSTLWLACAVNALVGVAALSLSRSIGAPAKAVRAPSRTRAAAAPPRFVLVAAAIVGFAFLLMELVWYRMLAPLLGGSSYTFGLILALALAGVAIGGLANASFRRGAPATLRGFAVTCALEALLVALPFALGDRIAVLALLLRPLGDAGFGGFVLGWTVVIAIVVFPAALISGAQFPLLVGLLGEGGADVGRHVGLAYAWNTAGAIAGSLAGGFGVVPLLTAPGTWRASVALLAALAGAALVVERARGGARSGLVAPGAVLAVAVVLDLAQGPTAAWRHGSIGAGRATLSIADAGPNAIAAWVADQRRAVVWEADGVESSLAVTGADGLAFVVGGKMDGHVLADAGTQVMGGLVGALLHPKPTRALVVGLGTGTTAGWLAAVPTMERVDVVELEPALRRVARDCTAVNHGVLDDLKVHVFIGDAREVLLATKERYDIVFSEPSNPYRAGIASLFTQDFYTSVTRRLAEGGIFLQWLQAYEIDAQTVRTALATLASVFPSVEVWTTQPGDLLLVATMQPTPIDLPKLRARVAEEPYRSALAAAWRVDDVEGVLAHFVARPSFARAVLAAEGGVVATDDRNVLEYGFARGIASRAHFDVNDVRRLAAARGEDRPELTGGEPDGSRVEDEREAASVVFGGTPPRLARGATPERARRREAYARYAAHDPAGALAAWRGQPRPPGTPFELEMIASTLDGPAVEDELVPLLDRLRPLEPVEADVLIGRLRLRQGRADEATALFVRSFERYRVDPWAAPDIVAQALGLAAEIARLDAASGRRLFDALREPFAVHMLDAARHRTLVQIASRTDFAGLCREAIGAYEPNPVWKRSFLEQRRRCYEITGDPRADAAARDLARFAAQEGTRFADGLEPAPSRAAGGPPAERAAGD